MITPERLNEIMASIEDYAGGINQYLLRHIAERIVEIFKNGDQFFMPSTITELRQLMAKGFSIEYIERIMISVMPSLQTVIHTAFVDAAKEISMQQLAFVHSIAPADKMASWGVPELEKIGITQEADKLHMTPVELRKMDEAYRRTNGTIQNLTRTTAEQCQKEFYDTCDMAYQKVQAGKSPQTAIVESIREMCDKGIEYVDYHSGKSDRVEVAISRAVRTGVNNANANIVLQRCAELGISYVLTSSHLGARITKKNDYTNHSLWQGRVFHLNWNSAELLGYQASITDQDEQFAWMAKMREEIKDSDDQNDNNYPDFVTACGWGNILGICGINCRHTFTAFMPGINSIPEPIDPEENAKRFALDQKQRKMEREIRKTKRILEGVKATGDKAEIKKVKDKLHQQSQAYLDFCKKNGLKPRNSALQTTYTKATNTKMIEGSENNLPLL